MRIDISGNTYLSTKDQYGNIINQPILVVAKTGGGKGLVLEMIGEDYHNQDSVVIALCDPKQEVELGFSMFYPEEIYHKNYLKAVGKKLDRKKVKLYHPITLDIPTKEYIPKYNFYTIPIKDLGDGEWSLLSETKKKSEAVTILEKASAEISDNDGLFGFTDKLSKAVSGVSKKGKKVADWTNFGFETGSGTIKDLSKVGGYLKDFQRHPFLSKKNSKYNLNWEEILNDQEHYHVFVTNYIDKTKYEKIIGFVILNLVQSIIRNKKLLKKHLVILIPEIKNLCPFKPEGYVEFLAGAFTFAISTLRSAGVSIISDTQNWSGLDKGIKDVFKLNLLGELTGNDIDEISKKWGGLKSEYKEFFRKPPKPNTFIIAESEYFQPFTFFLPSQMHKEPIPGRYNFETMYKKYSRKERELYPLEKYDKLVKEINDELKEEKKKFMDKYKNKKKQEEVEEKKKKEEKESKSEKKLEIESKVEKIKEKTSKTDEAIEKLCYEMFNEPDKHNLKSKKDGKASARDISKKLTSMGFEGVKTHVSVLNKIKSYQDKLEENQDKDFEDEFVESQ